MVYQWLIIFQWPIIFQLNIVQYSSDYTCLYYMPPPIIRFLFTHFSSPSFVFFKIFDQPHHLFFSNKQEIQANWNYSGRAYIVLISHLNVLLMHSYCTLSALLSMLWAWAHSYCAHCTHIAVLCHSYVAPNALILCSERDMSANSAIWAH